MNDHEHLEFARCMGILAESLREQISDIAIEGYFAALRDCPLADVQAAAAHLSKTCQWFPKPKEWHDAAKEQGRKALGPYRPGRDEPWHHECDQCKDEGWVCHVCGTLDCDKDAEPHVRRMRRCLCINHNTTYQRKNQHRGAA